MLLSQTQINVIKHLNEDYFSNTEIYAKAKWFFFVLFERKTLHRTAYFYNAVLVKENVHCIFIPQKETRVHLTLKRTKIMFSSVVGFLQHNFSTKFTKIYICYLIILASEIIPPIEATVKKRSSPC